MKNTQNFNSTKSLLDHLHRAHCVEYARLKQRVSKPIETTSSSTIRLLNDKPGSSTEKQPSLVDLVAFQGSLVLLRFCQLMLIFAFGKLTMPVKHLCKLTGDMCFAPIRMASKLQVCHVFY